MIRRRNRAIAADLVAMTVGSCSGPERGTYDYVCAIHESMTGQIVVN